MEKTAGEFYQLGSNSCVTVACHSLAYVSLPVTSFLRNVTRRKCAFLLFACKMNSGDLREEGKQSQIAAADKQYTIKVRMDGLAV